MKIKMPKIGLRIIKSALAVFICFLVSDIFHREYPFYSSIAALFTIQGTLHISWKNGLSRIAGATVGGLFGVLTVALTSQLPQTPANILQSFLISLVIILLIYLSVLLKYTDMAYISCVVFLSVIIFHSASAMTFAWNRIADTAIGILIAILINLVPTKRPHKSEENPE